MNYIPFSGGIIAVIVLATPVNAQDCPPWLFGCYQPQYQQTPLRTERHLYTKRSARHEKHYSSERKREPEVRYKTKTVTVVRQGKTWKDLSQDDARTWVKEQVQGFCGRYPKDEACQKKEQ